MVLSYAYRRAIWARWHYFGVSVRNELLEQPQSGLSISTPNHFCTWWYVRREYQKLFSWVRKRFIWAAGLPNNGNQRLCKRIGWIYSIYNWSGEILHGLWFFTGMSCFSESIGLYFRILLFFQNVLWSLELLGHIYIWWYFRFIMVCFHNFPV